MKEEHLLEAAWESDFLSAHTKDAECFRHTTCGQDEISHCQHGQKTKHGFMKAPHHCDDIEKYSFPSQL